MFGRTAKTCVLMTMLAAACGDDSPPATGGSTGDSTGAQTTGGAPVPTTGAATTGDGATGSATDSASSSPTSTPPTATGDPTSEPTNSSTSPVDDSTASDASTGPSTLDTTDASTDPSASDTSDASTDPSASDTSDATTDPGPCQTADDCPPPPPVECAVATCFAGICGAGPAPLGTPCSAGVCDAVGQCVGCTSADDCAAPPECSLATCEAAVCGAAFVMQGAPCSGGTCDGQGACLECQSPADCPAPLDCQLATCDAGACGTTAATPGSACSNGVCTAQSDCVECLDDGDCPGEICSDNACVPPPPSCNDNSKNGSETDIDCGGSCPGCADGDTCNVDADCMSNSCDDNVCGQPIPLCAQQAPDPATGQRCPLFMDCAQSSECGVFQGCQQWFCNNAKTCELNALVGCWTDVGGACNADVIFTQQTLPPVAKRFVPPDGVDFREVASLAFTVKNNTANDLYLDKLPLVLDVMGNGSKFDVSSVKIFDNSGGSEHGLGDILVCLTANPFSFPANGTMGPCAGSAFSRVNKNGGTNQFVVNLAFAADKTFINGRSYRLRMTSAVGVQFKVGFNGPLFAGSMCGVPNEGFTGAWVTAQDPS